MTQEEKDLLLKDLSGRLPYNVFVHTKFYGDNSDDIEEYDFVLNSIDTKYPRHFYWIGGEQLKKSGKFNSGTTDFAVDIDDDEQEIKPYLRPMSSMLEKEVEEFNELMYSVEERCINAYGKGGYTLAFTELNDWLNAHHFDYRGLIIKGLALKAPEDMYNNKKQ